MAMPDTNMIDLRVHGVVRHMSYCQERLRSIAEISDAKARAETDIKVLQVCIHGVGAFDVEDRN